MQWGRVTHLDHGRNESETTVSDKAIVNMRHSDPELRLVQACRVLDLNKQKDPGCFKFHQRIDSFPLVDCQTCSPNIEALDAVHDFEFMVKGHIISKALREEHVLPEARA